MKQTIWIGIVALALGACGKSETKPGSGSGSGLVLVVATKDGTDKGKPAGKQPAAELFTSKVPALPPPIDKIKQGMTSAEAKAAAPDVLAAKYDYSVPGFDGVEMKVHISDKTDRVYATAIEIAEPRDQVKGWLAGKWGEPRATKNSIGDALYFWDHPESGVRAKLEARASKSALTFTDVMSTEQLLGSSPGKFGFEKTPLLGATQEDVMKTYAAWGPTVREDDPGSITMNLPPLDTSEYAGGVDVRIKDGKVTGYTVRTSFSWDEATKAKLLAGLETLFGKPKKQGSYLEHPGPPKVTVDHDSKDQVVIWVGDYKK